MYFTTYLTTFQCSPFMFTIYRLTTSTACVVIDSMHNLANFKPPITYAYGAQDVVITSKSFPGHMYKDKLRLARNGEKIGLLYCILSASIILKVRWFWKRYKKTVILIGWILIFIFLNTLSITFWKEMNKICIDMSLQEWPRNNAVWMSLLGSRVEHEHSLFLDIWVIWREKTQWSVESKCIQKL